MVTPEELLSFMRESTYKPLNGGEFINALNITKTEEFMAMLGEMEQQGLIVFTRKKRYGLPERMGLIVGRLQGHAKGYGFLIPDKPELSDVFIGADNTNGAMHNDRIMVRMLKQSTGIRPEGEVIRILSRANYRVVGTYEDVKRYGFVKPDEKRLTRDIFIPKEASNSAKDGDKVIVEITKWPETRRNPEGKVVDVIGKSGAPGIDILSIIKKFQLPEEFSARVLEEADRVAHIRPEDYQGRRDLRDLSMVTIDGEDAKDLDDAVSLETLFNGNWYLGVHIADVGHYVRENSFLDKEALERATSVYLVDRVIPMLPKALSNNICSLNAGVERLAMTCFMEVDQKGTVISHEITPSIILVKERMTYTDVNKILLDNDIELKERYKDLVPMFEKMAELMKVLRKKRTERGAIGFEFPEAKVVVDEKGKPIEIIKRVSDVAEHIIEEFMILANETVAEDFFWREAPFLYRIHEQPDPEKLGELNEFLHRFGYHIKGMTNEIHPRAFQEIVEKVSGRPEERVINTVILRSMRHARYHPEPLGHFGLSSKYYSHFTSPIRRYPDLAIHRVIKEYLAKEGLKEGRLKKLKAMMDYYAEQSSFREKLAEDAERECVDLKKAQYMERHLGENFEGIISGVTSYGMYVELENTVEGLVHVSTMADDYYEFQEKIFAFVGRHTRKTYKLGDKVKIQVVRVDAEEGIVDFELVGDDRELS